MRILIDNGNTPAAPRPYIGHYGRLRKAYLEQYRPDAREQPDQSVRAVNV